MVVNVDKGEKNKIADFIGNEKLSDKTLRKAMKRYQKKTSFVY
jgi:outer membrane protein insertion porin family